MSAPEVLAADERQKTILALPVKLLVGYVAIAFFMTGAAVAQFFYPNGKSLLPSLDGKWNRFLTIPGKYSLYIYLGIQVVAVIVLWLLTIAVTGETYFI